MTLKVDINNYNTQQVINFLASQSDFGSHINLWESGYDNSIVRYHLSSQRSNLLRHLNFHGLRVLELNAGMGGLSRYLAESCEYLHAVSESPHKFKGLQHRLKDLSNWDGAVAGIDTYESNKKFDVICLVGLLENAPKDQDKNNQSILNLALKKARSHLALGGAVIVASQNKLGLQYWNGTEDEYTKRIFDGITGYAPHAQPKSLHKCELLDALKNHQFTHIEEFYPFPNYIYPMTVFHSDAFTMPPQVVAELAIGTGNDPYGKIRQPLYPDYLAMLEVARARLIPQLSNSFLCVAFSEQESPTSKVLLKNIIDGEQTWYYSERAKGSVATNFTKEVDGWRVNKQVLSEWKKEPVNEWYAVNEKLTVGESIREILERAAYHHDWKLLEDELFSFVKWLIDTKNYIENGMFLADAIWQNARKVDNGYQLFDQEWKVSLDDEKYTDFAGWIVFRNIIILAFINQFWDKNRPWKTLRELYARILKRLQLNDNYSLHIHNDAVFRATISGQENVSHHERHFDIVMNKKRRRDPFITSAKDWTTLTRYCTFFLPSLRILQTIETKLRQIKR